MVIQSHDLFIINKLASSFEIDAETFCFKFLSNSLLLDISFLSWPLLKGLLFLVTIILLNYFV